MNAPFLPRGHVRDPFSAFLCDLDTEDAARAIASDMGWPHERIHSGGLRYAVQSLAVSPSPAVLLVDLSESGDPLEDINALAEVCEPGTMVIACGHINDVRFYRELIAAGLHDYLVKPVSNDQLRDAVMQAQSAIAGARAAETAIEVPHMMAAVIGVRGGAGGSMMAVSLATLLSERGRSTGLLDLDVHFGTGALALDLEPGRGLTDAIENPGRIDGLFLERALVRPSDKLGVLSAEAPISQPLTGDGQAFYQLQDELRGAFACTVLDLPRHMLVQHPALLQDVNVTVLVTELTLAAARDTIRLLSWLKANAPRTRVLVIANKVPAAGQEEITRKEFESSIEQKLDMLLPFEPKLTVQAAKTGKPLSEVAKAAKIGQSLALLADAVLDEERAGSLRGASLLGRLRELKFAIAKKPKA
ncbi:AAA family ATPase [Sphingomonas nostoxanthinifaciens]|uniref:AAA family ATPase n=1 Tax=Sphingomonas nostoxanthinifaciens TaxID=2872652 RepID=UPI001CC1C2FD|nr:pilus assembly protein CpaE [Sphingomonas nostoxanthinifaciens]UAK24107.1 pilus assembly protein CpaE [Sphingomonas nostoxanthinifaciens]